MGRSGRKVKCESSTTTGGITAAGQGDCGIWLYSPNAPIRTPVHSFCVVYASAQEPELNVALMQSTFFVIGQDKENSQNRTFGTAFLLGRTQDKVNGG
jgi:hypothetical protein